MSSPSPLISNSSHVVFGSPAKPTCCTTSSLMVSALGAASSSFFSCSGDLGSGRGWGSGAGSVFVRALGAAPKNSKWKYEKAGSSSCKTREGLSSDGMEIQEIKGEDSDEESLRKTQCSADIESTRTGPRIVITHLKTVLIRFIRG